KLGVESAFEHQLHGTNGFREILVNAQGRSVEKMGLITPKLRTRAPVAGEDLILSLDSAVQRAAEDGLADHRGAVVALDPTNGDVLALASKPGFDPNEFARGLTRAEYAALADDIDRPLLNRALRGTYPSGSTIKPVLALAALTDHVMDPNRKIFSALVYHLPGSSHLFREDRTGPRGWIDMREAISRSSDVYFYQLAVALGIERIDSFLGPFGYGQPTGIDISGELPGTLPSPEWKRKRFKNHPEDQVWFPGETVNFGIGQGYLLVTPLQLAKITATLAERGRSFRPRLVKGIRLGDGRTQAIAPIENEPITGVAAADWDLVLNAMIGATRCEAYCGTAAGPFRNAAYTAAGKTGTAQVYTVAQNAKYNEKTVPERLRDHAWFVAFAPAEAPRIAVAVLVENVGFGSQFAAPIARKVLDTYLLGADGKLKPQFQPGAAPEQTPAATVPASPRAPEPGRTKTAKALPQAASRTQGVAEAD
ncbi:MAG TPA: penicillin-binding protein 2, partial [Steroidobacteraceae bacterium]|nr:penicillin-binding protein 2 [Steroidobacteraceae bacterium]